MIKATPKTIQVFLMDGDAQGRIKTTISNFTGMAYKIPRDKLSSAKEITQLAHSGIYFLFGQDCVYVGQAGYRQRGNAILERLLEHDKSPDKNFWTEAIAFTKSDNTMGPTELNYLENKFYKMILSANRYEIKNGNIPSPGNITEEKQSEMDEFSSYVELILGVLGYKVFTPKTNQETTIKAPITSLNITIPPLPERNSSTKIGEWIRLAMKQLSDSGYVFNYDVLLEMATPEWRQRVFDMKSAKRPFIRICENNIINTKDENNYVRFWSEPFSFGDYKILISKEWYDYDFDRFAKWYNSL